MLSTTPPRTYRPSFQQQLNYLRTSLQQPESQSNSQHIGLVNSVLDMLSSNHPFLTSELASLKQGIAIWSDHLYRTLHDKNRQLIQIKSETKLYIEQQLGVVLQEIGMFLRSLNQQYHDQNLKRYYVRYLLAIKQIRWNKKNIKQNQSYSHKQIQTEFIDQNLFEESPGKHNFRTMTSLDSPLPYKKVDQQRYQSVKRENLQLENQVKQLEAKVADLQELNKHLKGQIDRLFDQNIDYRKDNQRNLLELKELSGMLDRMKKEEEEKASKELELTPLKNNQSLTAIIAKNLRQLEQQIANKEEEQVNKEQTALDEESQREFARNYKVIIDNDCHNTIKKDRKENKDDVCLNSYLRMLLIQASSIQSFLLEIPPQH